MQDKIALEEHFATPDTIGDSERYFTADIWPARRRQLLDLQEERIERMDACGIGYTILSLNAPAVQAIADPRRAIDVARRANDLLAEQVARRPERFGAFAALPLQDPDAAARELDRAVTELGFKGALVNGFSQIGSADNATYYDLPQYWPFWGEVERLGVPFYLHPRNPLPSQQLAYEGHPWLLGPGWAFSPETGVHALRLIGSGLFDAYPSLQVILGHLGELVQNNIWRTSHWASATGKNPLGVKAKRPFIDYFREHFHVTTSGNFRTIAMRNAIDEIGGDRVLFSTDYPFETMEEASTWFDAAEIGDNDRQKIGRDNAKRLFRLN
ncbi:MAG: amidohydrolase [Burkholderia sp.]|uniref:amidohydrolase family protein n=1 Tax=Burkholderia TaxID=32008 RepID=UPI00158BD1E8|nr:MULTISPECIES: amidohydrolase family protein [Burkholderia]MBY8608804.1 amidohydrolase family protein [Burkholderia arboris]MCA3780516.1 amidohydrolase [Burkholderia sp.]MCA3797608.1 amidohydrolase [Burkholderia sp.]MCA3803841.1 amidohydrolase [Burkholderia sp.]MCA3807137.1 amidohydrolase [Burkholderia sp.]